MQATKKAGRPKGSIKESSLTDPKPIRFDRNDYEFLEGCLQEEGCKNLGELIRKIVGEWVERKSNNEEEVTNLDLLNEIRSLKAHFSSEPSAPAPKPLKKEQAVEEIKEEQEAAELLEDKEEQPSNVDFNIEQADGELNNFFAQLNGKRDSKEEAAPNNPNQIVEVEKDDISDTDPIPSKKLTFNNFTVLSEEEQMAWANFFIDWGLGTEFGDIGKNGSMELKGEILTEFEEKFGVIEEVLEDIPF